MIRERLRSTTHRIKLGVTGSYIQSARTRTEEQTAVRLYDSGCIGLAGAVGSCDIDALTARAKESLRFEIPYAPDPEGEHRLSAVTAGTWLDLDELAHHTEHILSCLRSEFPQLLFSHGVEQRRNTLHIQNDAGLDLAYECTQTEVAFIVKVLGSGNIFDSLVLTTANDLDTTAILNEFRRHLVAFKRPIDTVPSGRQRVIIPGLHSGAGMTLLKLFRTDLGARRYSKGASFFADSVNNGPCGFHPEFRLMDTRDVSQYAVCPFDREGFIRQSPNLDLVRDGGIPTLLADKRDAHRFGVQPTGSAAGETTSLPTTASGHFIAEPTAPDLKTLLNGEPATLIWFTAGGDVTRNGDIAIPLPVAYSISAQGEFLGRYPQCTATANLRTALGEDFVGVTQETVDPFSKDRFVVTHMTLHS